MKVFEVWDNGKWLATFRFSGDAIGYCHVKGIPFDRIVERIVNKSFIEKGNIENLNNG